MCRVGDDHVGPRYGGHHSFAGSRALLTADSRLQLRIAFHFPLLLTDFIAGHFEPRIVPPYLIRDVDQGDRDQPADESEQPSRQEATDRADGAARMLRRQLLHFRPTAHDGERADAPQQDAFGHRLAELDQAIGRQDILESGNGIEACEIDFERARREHPAREEQRRCKRRDQDQTEEGQHRDEHVRGERVQAGEHSIAVEGGLPVQR